MILDIYEVNNIKLRAKIIKGIKKARPNVKKSDTYLLGSKILTILGLEE